MIPEPIEESLWLDSLSLLSKPTFCSYLDRYNIYHVLRPLVHNHLYFAFMLIWEQYKCYRVHRMRVLVVKVVGGKPHGTVITRLLKFCIQHKKIRFTLTSPLPNYSTTVSHSPVASRRLTLSLSSTRGRYLRVYFV